MERTIDDIKDELNDANDTLADAKAEFCQAEMNRNSAQGDVDLLKKELANAEQSE
jgi:phage shock protein A